MLEARIKKIIGKLPEQNSLFDFLIKWEGGGERKVDLTIKGLQGLVDEHGSPSPHAGLAKLASVQLNNQQIWP